jgi:hypothetical protein
MVIVVTRAIAGDALLRRPIPINVTQALARRAPFVDSQ